ncbi:MAG: High-affinity zinc uptake system binding-protein ZnuA [Candidatus Dichloromethanomonas elyunquensis]|nr:MAG: High-affinity zinc uptake system binding-protein ZnuA [Candidatus Dichloromethanomonas elyunquensis]
MKMFFKLPFVILLVLLLSIMGGCSAVPADSMNKGTDKHIVIGTSFYPLYIMTLNIIKDIPGIDLVNIAPPQTGCLHDYQLTTNDLKKMEQSQILVVNGAGMENYLDSVIRQLPGLKVIEATKDMEFIRDSGPEVNAHVWVSISGAVQEVKNISEQLAGLDPVHAGQYRKNGDIYIAKLEELKGRMHQALDGLKNKDIITFHEAFPYFAKEFGLNIAAVIEREPGSEPSAKEIAETITLVREKGVKAIFAEPQYSPAAAETISRETGAKVYLLDPAVTGEMNPDAYLQTMEMNLKVLFEALQ